MRVLVTTIGSSSHFYTVVPMAWACRAAGHEILVATPPPLAEVVLTSGLPQVSLDDERPMTPERRALLEAAYHDGPWPDGWPADPEMLDDSQRAVIRRQGEFTVGRAAAAVGGLRELAESWRADMIMHDVACLAGEVAAASMGIPNVRIHSGDLGLPRYEMGDLKTKPLPGYAALFARLGVPPRTTPTLTVNPCPPRMPLPIFGYCLHARYVAYNGAGAAPRWLTGRRARPRVCLTWGTTVARMLGDSAADPYRQALDILSEHDVEAVVVTTATQIDSLGPLPSWVRVAESTPLHLVLPFCDAVVHHGGATTMLTAATAGIPQLIITRNPIYECTGTHLSPTGAGIHLRHQQLGHGPARSTILAPALHALLHDVGYRHAAQELRAEMESQRTPHDLVPVLEALNT